MRTKEWEHSWFDHRGTRDVYVNGRKISQVLFADTARGKVRAFRQPFKLDKHKKRMLTYTLHGRVVVQFVNRLTHHGM